MDLALKIIVALLVAGVASLILQRLRISMSVCALTLGLGRDRFRVRRSRIVGELAMIAAVAYVSHQIFFYGSKFAPQEATSSIFHVHLPFLHWFATTFGLAIIIGGGILITAAFAFVAVMQYEMVTPLCNWPVNHGSPIHIRMALFNTDVVFISRRHPGAWLRTELSCLVLAVLLGATQSGVSAAEMTHDKTFRRLLGPTASDWPTLISQVTSSPAETDVASITSDLVSEALDPIAEKATGLAHSHLSP